MPFDQACGSDHGFWHVVRRRLRRATFGSPLSVPANIELVTLNGSEPEAHLCAIVKRIAHDPVKSIDELLF
jgi:hypothetical protein